MKTELSSKERILKTIQRMPTDHIPICFNSICHGGVRFVDQIFPNPFRKAEYYMELGVDTGVNVNLMDFNQYMGLSNFTSHENISIKQWKEHAEGEECALSIKEYATSKGVIRHSVRRSEEYPHHIIPLFSDFNVPPTRTIKYLLEKEEELDKLECILKAPSKHELDKFFEFALLARNFCDRNGVPNHLLWN